MFDLGEGFKSLRVKKQYNFKNRKINQTKREANTGEELYDATLDVQNEQFYDLQKFQMKRLKSQKEETILSVPSKKQVDQEYKDLKFPTNDKRKDKKKDNRSASYVTPNISEDYFESMDLSE